MQWQCVCVCETTFDAICQNRPAHVEQSSTQAPGRIYFSITHLPPDANRCQPNVTAEPNGAGQQCRLLSSLQYGYYHHYTTTTCPCNKTPA